MLKVAFLPLCVCIQLSNSSFTPIGQRRVLVTDAAVVQLEDPALYRLPIIEQTRITVQVGLHAAIISLILILCVTQCINQGMGLSN